MPLPVLCYKNNKEERGVRLNQIIIRHKATIFKNTPVILVKSLQNPEIKKSDWLFRRLKSSLEE